MEEAVLKGNPRGVQAEHKDWFASRTPASYETSDESIAVRGLPRLQNSEPISFYSGFYVLSDTLYELFCRVLFVEISGSS